MEDTEKIEEIEKQIKQLEELLQKWYEGNETYQPKQTNTYIDLSTPNVCENCSSNPKNGGSGFCCCALPYLNQTTY